VSAGVPSGHSDIWFIDSSWGIKRPIHTGMEANDCVRKSAQRWKVYLIKANDLNTQQLAFVSTVNIASGDISETCGDPALPKNQQTNWLLTGTKQLVLGRSVSLGNRVKLQDQRTRSSRVRSGFRSVAPLHLGLFLPANIPNYYAGRNICLNNCDRVTRGPNFHIRPPESQSIVGDLY